MKYLTIFNHKIIELNIMKFILSLLVIVLTISYITARKVHSDHKKNPKWQTHAQKHGLKFNSEEEEVSALVF